MPYDEKPKKSKPGAAVKAALGGGDMLKGMGPRMRERMRDAPMPAADGYGDAELGEGMVGPERSSMLAENMDTSLTPDIVDWAELAFPDMAGDTQRISALRNFIRAVSKSGF